jgi:recyclin-1
MSPTRTRFLESHNPQQVKRNVVAGFTDVLMLPVTIIPRAVGAVAVGAGTLAVGAARTTGRLALGAATTTGSLAVGAAKSGIAGISMLNPTKWGGAADSARVQEGYTTPLSNGDTDGSGYLQAKERRQAGSWLDEQEQVDWDRETSSHPKTDSIDQLPLDNGSGLPRASSSTSIATQNASSQGPPSLDLFLSLDVALELIHAARDSMKRLESFFPPRSRHATQHKKSTSISKPTPRAQHWSVDGFPGPSGRRLRETLEEIFILLLIALRERHIEPGFNRAIEQMRQYQPVDLAGSGSNSSSSSAVAPILGFFELVHIGDTIGSMIQVYFDREMAPYIDINDFLSGIMREKKKFENSLDEEVAKGLNAGTEVLLTQVEHLLWSRTSGREYCPPEGTVMVELTPTRSCKEVIECLETHCRIVRGSTSREVLEVFYAEVGMRLHR